MFATRRASVSELWGVSDELHKINDRKDPWRSRPSGEGLDMAKQTLIQNDS